MKNDTKSIQVSPQPLVNLEEAKSFLDMFAPGERLTFQTFAEGTNDSGPKQRARILHGTIDELGERLKTLNADGAGIFFMVNAGDCLGRSKSNVVRVRAQFVDLDSAPIAPVLEARPQPSIVVESSPDKWHAYWLIDDCPLGQFTACQVALAKKFNGDPSVKDLPRVMRVPGFLHQKSKPFLTRLADIKQLERA